VRDLADHLVGLAAPAAATGSSGCEREDGQAAPQ
jgi:hypothetical protein